MFFEKKTQTSKFKIKNNRVFQLFEFQIQFLIDTFLIRLAQFEKKTGSMFNFFYPPGKSANQNPLKLESIKIFFQSLSFEMV